MNFVHISLKYYRTMIVYPTDIKKLISWYNILVSNNITDFEDVEAEKETTEAE